MQTKSGPAVRRSAVPDPVVDRALAGRLIADGRVRLPESKAWEGELLDLMTTARRRLMFSPSVFLMGEMHVSLFLVTRDDLAAVAPDEVTAAEDVASKHRKPRGERAPVRPAVRPVSARTGSWAVPPAAATLPETSSEIEVYAEVVDLPVASSAVSDLDTGEPASDGFVATDVELASVEFAADVELASVEFADADTQPIAVIGGAARRAGGTRRKILAVGAATGGVIVAGGLLTSLIVGGGADDAQPQAAPAAPSVPVEPVTSAEPVLDPVALKDLTKPVSVYMPPPRATASRQPSNRNAPRPKPRGRFLPNPIPGLPPIPLP